MATSTGQVGILHNGVRLRRQVTIKKSLKKPEINVCIFVKWAINPMLNIYTQNTTRSFNQNLDRFTWILKETSVSTVKGKAPLCTWWLRLNGMLIYLRSSQKSAEII